jgi:hypothetical protein
MHMKVMKQKKAIAALLAIAVVAIAAIGAYAYWTSSDGNGTGTALTGDITTGLHVTQTSDTGPAFTPGGTGQVLGGTIESTIATGGSHVYVNTLTATLAAPTGGDGPSCDTSDYAFVAGNGWTVSTTTTTDDTATYTGIDTDLAPLASTPWSGLQVEMVNKTSTNQDDCKNATLNFDYVASAS